MVAVRHSRSRAHAQGAQRPNDQQESVLDITSLVRTLVGGLPLALLAACAGAPDQPLGIAEPRWVQRPEELGRLPVGIVVSVTRISEPGMAKAPQVDYVEGWPNMVSPKLGANPLGLGALEGRGTAVYRHVVKLGATAVRQVDTEYDFAVGDCVAIRVVGSGAARSVQLVSALPGACSGR